MITRRFMPVVLALHVAYAVLWLAMSHDQRHTFERYAVAGAEVTAFVFYLVLIVAFYEAQKTRLNVALAVQKFYWWLLIGALALPVALGAIYYGAPFRDGSPYALFNAPAWLRTYIWLGLAISLIGVLYEFWRANWGTEPEPAWPQVERRRDPYGRRITDQPGHKDVVT